MGHDHSHSHGGSSILAFLAGAATAAAVGTYMLYGPHGRENRRTLDRFMLRAKRDILAKMQDVGDMTEEQYGAIVDEVSNRYARMKGVGKEKARQMSARFKERWDDMRQAAEDAKNRAEEELADEEDEDSFL